MHSEYSRFAYPSAHTAQNIQRIWMKFGIRMIDAIICLYELGTIQTAVNQGSPSPS